ncbi:hypothetical protein HYV49_00920 [Candidatus Pacearchaeota archaeon]|nr:hypothetical protein [Candidatus Pacearchaeota archaeon]
MSKRVRGYECKNCGANIKVGYNTMKKSEMVKCQNCWQEADKKDLQNIQLLQEL